MADAILEAAGKAANNSQQAIAISAYRFIFRLVNPLTKVAKKPKKGQKKPKEVLVKSRSRLMIEMPPGTGKSIVIALLIGLVSKLVNKITILYNDVDLLEFERETIT